LVLKYKPDIVHTHTTKVGILGRLAALVCGVPIILHTFHGHIFTGYFSEKASKAIACLERILARFTDKIVTLSPALKAEIYERLHPMPLSKIAVIPLGLELEKFKNQKRKNGLFRNQLGINANTFLIGIVARLVPVKNHLLLLDVFKEVLEQNPDSHLVIVGDGEMRQAIEDKIKALNLKKNVSMTGIRKDIKEVYSDLDLLVLVSKNEGTPVVLIEALSAGCPVAATPVGGVMDLLKEGSIGKIIPVEKKQMADKLCEAIVESTSFQKANEQLREEICKKYSVERLVSDMDNCYRSILESRGKLPENLSQPFTEN
jgi:glycosyltransferase involved in cell wall biosynthesis